MANDIGLKALNQVSGSTDIMFTDRRNFYLDEQYTAELWSDVTPFLNFSASVNTIRGLKDPDFLLFEHRGLKNNNLGLFKSGYKTGTSSKDRSPNYGTIFCTWGQSAGKTNI